jgi:hypothetical protein
VNGSNFVSLNQPHQNHDNGDDQKNVNEVAHRVAGNYPEQPQNDQNESKCVEHKNSGRSSLQIVVRQQKPNDFSATMRRK